MTSRDEEIAEMEREQVRKGNELERVEKELEAINSEFELEKEMIIKITSFIVNHNLLFIN